MSAFLSHFNKNLIASTGFSKNFKICPLNSMQTYRGTGRHSEAKSLFTTVLQTCLKILKIFFLDTHVSITSGSVILYTGNEVVSEYLNEVG